MKHSHLFLLVACSAAEIGTPIAKDAPPDVYDVHEWGMIDQSLADGSLRLSAPSQGALTAGTIGLGLTGIGYGKPVLYFHVESGKRIAIDASVGVTHEMRMVEHWPRAFASDTEVRWELELVPEPCDEPRTYPSSSDAFCTRMSDGICETAELPEYETDDASCLIVDGTQWPLLLYRAAAVEEAERPESRVELPLEIEKQPDGNVRIRNRSGASSPLAMFRVTRRASQTQVTRIEWPAPGETVTVPRPAAEATGDTTSRQSVREALSQQGLTEPEAEAFFRAWEEELWGVEPDDEEGGETAEVTGASAASLGLRGYGRGGGSVGGPPIGLGRLGTIGIGGLPGTGYGRFTDVLIYWLPPSIIDELAPLTFEPAPRNVKRAMMVRVSLL